MSEEVLTLSDEATMRPSAQYYAFLASWIAMQWPIFLPLFPSHNSYYSQHRLLGNSWDQPKKFRVPSWIVISLMHSMYSYVDLERSIDRYWLHTSFHLRPYTGRPREKWRMKVINLT